MLARTLAFLFAMTCAFGAVAETVYLVAPDSDEGIYARELGEKTLPGGAADLVVTQNGLTFNVFFLDISGNTNVGFDSPTFGAPARARLEEAMRYMADVINQPGTLDVVVEQSETDGGGALAFAGTFYSTAAGFQNGSTLERLKTGSKPFGGFEEISCTVDFGFAWNFTTGAPAANQADFRSVILHEFTHGLGFSSLSASNGSSQIAAGVFTKFDQLMRRRTGNKVLFSGSPPAFVGVNSDLISNDLMFFGTQANVLYAQPERPGIFAPNPFSSGSSLSHWDTDNIVGGAVMEHAITLGEQKRTYAPVDIGALIDIGYTNAADPGASPGNLTVNPSGTVNLGSAVLGQFITQNFTVSNNGGTSFTGVASAAAPYSVTSGANYTLGPGASTTVTVRFTPAALGLAVGTLNLTGDPDGATTVTLNGTGINVSPASLTVSPNPGGGVNFGNVQTGAFVNQVFTVQNTGGTAANVTAASSGAPFSVTSGANFTLNPGASNTVTVRFAPVAVGAFSKTLTVNGDPDGAIVVNLNGSGTSSPGNLVTNPDITPGIDMGEVESGASSELSFTLTNNGGAAITGQASTDGAPFSISVGASYNLAGGASTTVKVLFTPTDTGDFSGTLTLTGDPDGAIAVDLIGTGLKAGNAACSVVKGQRNTWSLADGLVVALCGVGLVVGTRRAVRVRP